MTAPTSALPAEHTPGTDPERWPDIVTLPRVSRARTAVAERIVRRALGGLPLRARLAGR
ncbi:SAM-dependent methyltransferase, partial [Streptomyces sp. SID7982]|nr:SAM-dependent methyltransferase [Streptomyces sp. SID7982]